LPNRTFVKAEWTDLVLLNYAVSDDALAPFVGDLEIDRWNGSGYVSVVGFYFGKTRVFGVAAPIPNIRNFAQWNFRTYVRDRGPSGEDVPGIVFIKEFVPNPAVTALARSAYNENYHTARIGRYLHIDDDRREVRYRMDYDGSRHSIAMHTNDQAAATLPGSADYFFVERYAGRPRGVRTIRFSVSHPPWYTYKVSSYVASIDFRHLYGEDWAFLNDRVPDYVSWCSGSAIAVSFPVKG